MKPLLTSFKPYRSTVLSCLKLFFQEPFTFVESLITFLTILSSYCTLLRYVNNSIINMLYIMPKTVKTVRLELFQLSFRGHSLHII